uniref:Uncharacterized protein n=1 Tax=Tetraselmis sp. GSL018 TaxID=582737 RepID=A0A061QZG5_9CHLO|eukprot:CAMPEP_0177610174 /NCGR_PEP_ID=MMETSP0419_2-20121207/19610_1 /TAXON_ID=582737 /ORGANISM="Tetraselmis sp., Strain GSL018" /LENGTH=198 /DNA_ID=CAMNT_0019105405 /DNA_START=59 /DNA_END=655 /DNA_ORIENTATION=+
MASSYSGTAVLPAIRSPASLRGKPCARPFPRLVASGEIAFVAKCRPSTSSRRTLSKPQSSRSVRTQATQEKETQPQETGGQGVTRNTEFGYSRKDVILIGLGFLALGYGLYYGLQALGMEPGMAGNWVQLVVILGMMVGWVSTYLFRVATKQMTYVKQLEDYETAVMAKRMEEMPESELENMLDELEQEKNKQKKTEG